MSLNFKRASPNGTTDLIHTADVWTEVSCTKTSAGDLVIGNFNNLIPTNTGAGFSVPSGTITKFLMGPGEALYAASDTYQTAHFIFQPLPWILQIVNSLGGMLDTISKGKSQQGKADPYFEYIRNALKK